MPPGSEHSSTDGRSVWTAEEIMLRNKPTLVKFKYFVLVRLRTFQPTLVRLKLEDDAKMDPPTHTEYLFFGGIMILISMLDGAMTVIYFF